MCMVNNISIIYCRSICVDDGLEHEDGDQQVDKVLSLVFWYSEEHTKVKVETEKYMRMYAHIRAYTTYAHMISD